VPTNKNVPDPTPLRPKAKRGGHDASTFVGVLDLGEVPQKLVEKMTRAFDNSARRAKVIVPSRDGTLSVSRFASASEIADAYNALASFGERARYVALRIEGVRHPEAMKEAKQAPEPSVDDRLQRVPAA